MCFVIFDIREWDHHNFCLDIASFTSIGIALLIDSEPLGCLCRLSAFCLLLSNKKVPRIVLHMFCDIVFDERVRTL